MQYLPNPVRWVQLRKALDNEKADGRYRQRIMALMEKCMPYFCCNVQTNSDLSITITFTRVMSTKKQLFSQTLQIEISKIVLRGNTRTDFNQDEIKELAASLKSVGLINPITVRMDGEEYILISGERRLRAAKLNKWKTIDCRVSNKADENTVRDIQLIENCQRKDIHPIEEALAFRNSTMAADEIALRIGKSIQYVKDRFNLMYLNESVADLFKQNVISLSHALQFARLTHEEQDRILEVTLQTTGRGDEKKILGMCTVNQLRERIARNASVSLTEAKFSPYQKDLHPGFKSCKQCERRSGYNTSLFNDIEEKDICFNVACFAQKNIFHSIAVKEQLNALGATVTPLTGFYQATSITEKYGMQNDFVYATVPIELSDVTEGQHVGIYFEHPVRAKVGTAVLLTARSEEVEETVVRQKSESNVEIKHYRASKSFVNALMDALAQRIGESDTETLPRPVKMMVCESLFMEMPFEQQAEIIKFYKWDFKPSIIIEQNRVGFRAATENSDSQELVHLLMVFLVYGTLKGTQPGSPAYYYVDMLCKHWRINVVGIVTKIESEFGVSLNVFKDLFDGKN